MKNPARSLIALLAGNALLLLMTKLMFLDIIVVRGSSMAPSLKEGTPIFVNKLAYGLRNPFTGSSLLRWGHAARGDIVVFHNPRENTVTVKRCLATRKGPSERN
jgi:signal peptidase I